MAETNERDKGMFPTLNDEQIARLRPFATERRFNTGDIIFDQGDTQNGVLVILEGSIDIESVVNGVETVIVTHKRGEFAGEVSQLSGRRSLARCRAHEATTLLEISRTDLQRLMQSDVELGEIFLRAFVLRRVYMINNSLGDAVLIGSNNSADTLRLRRFFSRNGHPFTYLDVEKDADVQTTLDHFHVQESEIPVLICRGDWVLRNPTDAEAAECFGLNQGIDESEVYDVIVIGAGPGGLAAAVYGASEGLRVLALEGNAPGGQAGTSSKIENYLGFPMGISGQELAARAFIQAQKFGANIAVARYATALKCARSPYAIDLDDGATVKARTLVVAAGAKYRKLDVSNLAQYEGVGVYYGATKVEGQLCAGQSVAVVGGGNSAGQAAIFLSTIAKQVYLLVRGPGLKDTMSRYLISRIESCGDITFKPFTEIEELHGEGHLQRLTWRNNQTGERETCDVQHLFVMTGASPNTGWLEGCVAMDSNQFIKTGQDVQESWTLRRPPFLLETSLPGVFAVGDVRSGSVKRVAAAVGEGSMAIQFVHKVLAE